MNRLQKFFRLRRKRQELEDKRQVLTDRLVQTVHVYLREWDNPIPDVLLRRNDRDVMRTLLADLNEVNRDLKELR